MKKLKSDNIDVPYRYDKNIIIEITAFNKKTITHKLNLESDDRCSKILYLILTSNINNNLYFCHSRMTEEAYKVLHKEELK